MTASATLPVVDVVDVLKGDNEALKQLSRDVFAVRVRLLPRPRIRIRAKKRVIPVEDSKIARAEYALLRASMEEALGIGSSTFRRIATLLGDYKVAAAYIVALWQDGFVELDREASLLLYRASASMSQKTYEHSIAKAIDAHVKVSIESLEKSPAEEILCASKEDITACRYLLTRIPKDQAKAEVKALIDVSREAGKS
ncbi:MAG: hypothetical protein ABWW70_01740 [Thermoproteota archaeon]